MRDNGRYHHFGSDAAGMAAERLCENAIIDFTAAFDLGDFDGMSRVFAADGVWKRQDGDVVGMSQLRNLMSARASGLLVRHVLSNVRTTFSSATDAVVDSYLTVYRHDFPGEPGRPAPLGGPNLVGRYRDRLSLRADEWKLAGREVTVDFKQQQSEQQR